MNYPLPQLIVGNIYDNTYSERDVLYDGCTTCMTCHVLYIERSTTLFDVQCTVYDVQYTSYTVYQMLFTTCRSIEEKTTHQTPIP